MRYTPWIRLARWEAASPGAPENKAPRSASRTLLVDYPNMSPPKALDLLLGTSRFGMVEVMVIGTMVGGMDTR